MDDDKRHLVISLLKNSPEGLSIQDISIKALMDRNTIRIILAELLGSRLIRQQIRGNLKLNFWVGRHL